METVRSVVASLCVSLVFFGVVMMLTPDGAMHKNIKTFLSIAIVSVIVAVISGISVNIQNVDTEFLFDYNASYAEGFGSKVEELNISATENSVRSLIAERLTKREVKFYEITVRADISDETSISITEIEIVCPPADTVKCRAVLDELGLTGTITEREE